MKIKSIVLLEKKRLQNENDSILRMLAQLPDGEILFHKSKSHYRWRQRTEIGTPARKICKDLHKTQKDDRELARQLCLKHFLQNQLEVNLSRLQMLDQVLLMYRDESLLPLPDPTLCEDYHLLLDTFFASKREFAERWASSPYEKSTEHPESLTFVANNGVYMRSKSEVLIANMLLERNIPFRYEQALHCGDAIYHPDFTILDPRTMRDLIIWEHFGRMDSVSYIRNNMDKFEAYCRKGFYYGKNFIVTFESKEAPLTEETVALTIDGMFGDLTRMF